MGDQRKSASRKRGRRIDYAKVEILALYAMALALAAAVVIIAGTEPIQACFHGFPCW